MELMQEGKQRYEISPKEERGWRPTMDSDFEISPKEPTPRLKHLEIDPSKEGLSTPERPRTNRGRERSLSTALAIHLALGSV